MLLQKLKRIIPSLGRRKRVTKLETICQACLYIEKMQETLTIKHSWIETFKTPTRKQIWALNSARLI